MMENDSLDDQETAPLRVDPDCFDADFHRRVNFLDQVSIVRIPSHTEYSNEEKARIWADRNEISCMAARNLIEFAAEGFDWRNVTEDEHMIEVHGQTIHPVHGNPLLIAALTRQLPYPQPRYDLDLLDPLSSENEEDHGTDSLKEDDEAVDRLDEPVERPSSPFIEEPEGLLPRDEYDDFICTGYWLYQHNVIPLSTAMLIGARSPRPPSGFREPVRSLGRPRSLST